MIQNLGENAIISGFQENDPVGLFRQPCMMKTRKKIELCCMISLCLGAMIASIAHIWCEKAYADTATPAQTPNSSPSLHHLDLLSRLLFTVSSRGEAQVLFQQIADSGDTRFVAGLIDMLRYHRAFNQEIGQTLNRLTGQSLPADEIGRVRRTCPFP